MTDPVSWLQIEKGWNVVGADGILVGKVVEVTGDQHDDIFDGLAVKSEQSARVRYVPGEQVAAIFPGEVTLKIVAAEADALEPFREPPPSTTVLPQKGTARDSGLELAARKALDARSLSTLRSGHNVWRAKLRCAAREVSDVQTDANFGTPHASSARSETTNT